MILAPITLIFRVHTRVLATLSVALLIAALSLASPSAAPLADCPAIAEKCAVQTTLPLAPSRSGLPRTLVRVFFLLPHLIPHDR
jgi:hypothetical protein